MFFFSFLSVDSNYNTAPLLDNETSDGVVVCGVSAWVLDNALGDA